MHDKLCLICLNSESYMSVHVLLNLFNKLLKSDKIRGFCGSFMFLFCRVFAMSLCASVYMCFVVTCGERADLLALVCGV